MLHQTFQLHDLFIILVLVLLEALLSLDNALVLGLLARKLPDKLQSKALTYGLIGSFIFRFIAILAAAWLLEWRIVKLLGGVYLLYVSIHHLLFEKKKEHPRFDARRNPVSDEELDDELFYQTHGGAAESEPADSTRTLAFWTVVGSIELTDIAFAVDSILAGIALIGPAPQGARWHPKLWVIFLGGMFGVMLMRFAAFGFIRLLERFPRFELSGYLMVAVVGLKLSLDWLFNGNVEKLNFESPMSPTFWIFWVVMAACFATGFGGKRQASRIED